MITQATWSVLAEQLRALRKAAGVGESLEAVRAGRVILGEEIRAGRPKGDRGAPVDDSLSLRAFRGVAVPCSSGAGPGQGERMVRYRGLRTPDPGKDSLLLLGMDGRWRLQPLARARPVPGYTGPCPEIDGGGRVEGWWVGGDGGGDFVLVRLFERGSYHVADRALRYRRGKGGRQPLTPEILDAAGSELVPAPDGAVRLRLAFRPCVAPGCPGAWDATIHPTRP